MLYNKFTSEQQTGKMEETSFYGNQNYFISIINSVEQPVFVKNKNHQFVFINEAFSKLYGCKKEDIIGKSSGELFNEQDSKICQEQDNVVFETGTESLNVVSFADSENMQHKVQIRKNFFLHENGEKLIIGTIRDITEINEAELFLQTALEKQKQLNGLKTNLMSMISHEFRTPLTLIMSSSEIIEKYNEGLTEQEKERFFKHIYNGVNKMIGMLDNILILGRTESEYLVLQTTKFNLDELCLNVIKETEISFSMKSGIKFENNSGLNYIILDEKLIRQILANLLSNAIKYSARRKQDKKVKLEITADCEYLSFIIVDNGVGLPVEEQSKLFEPFYRGSNTQGIPGNGLGLAIVKRAVELHSGIIKFRSIDGIGTAFTVKIPIAGRIPDIKPNGESKN